MGQQSGVSSVGDGVSYGLAVVALLLGAALSLMFMVMEWLFIIPVGALALLFFLVFDGYKAIYIFVKTLPRDLRAGLCLLKVLWQMRQCQKNNLTVIKLFRKNVAKFPNKVCLIFGEQRWTFAQLDEYSNRVSNLFLSRGFQKGDPVALFMENRPEYVGIWLGLAKAGILPALINFNLRLKPLIHSITVINAKALVYGTELSHAVADISNDLGASFPKFSSGGGDKASLVPGAEDLDSQITQASPIACEDKSNYSDKLLYIYTSGTTGLPKAAVIAHSRYLFAGLSPSVIFGIDHRDVLYMALPQYHFSGAVIGVGHVLLVGVTGVLRIKFSVTYFWTDCHKYKCTVSKIATKEELYGFSTLVCFVIPNCILD